MKRTSIASYALTASAFVLAALIFLQASHRLEQKAVAEMVVNSDTVSMVTTQFRTDSEILYLLDGRRGALVAYMLDPNQRSIVPLPGGTMNVAGAFGGANPRGGANPKPQR